MYFRPFGPSYTLRIIFPDFLRIPSGDVPVNSRFPEASMTATDETTTDEKKKKHAHPPDRTRETIETIVFVVVLVLLLKLFVTEAFVIPTGSMAETLYGYQKIVTCPKCGHEFPVNSHDEVEGAAPDNNAGGPRRAVIMTGATCPNCRFNIKFSSDGEKGTILRPDNRTGDRVLVLKPIFHVKEPNRGDVVVFKYPQAPQERHVAQNYIKRAMGFGGETLAIFHGDLYVTRALEYPEDAVGPDGFPLYERPTDPLELWKSKFMYPNNQKAIDIFESSKAAGFPVGQGGFEIVRKGVDQLLADRRIVWDNDQQPQELAGKAVPRWFVAPGALKWKGDTEELPRYFTHSGGDLEWVRYRHVIYPWDAPETAKETKPAHIDNMLGYNSEVAKFRDNELPTPSRSTDHEKEWVGDLILECEAVLKEDSDEVILELSKGLNRFQATFANGTVKLASIGPGAREFGNRPCKVKGSGTYKLRFANVDARLRVWVDDHVIDFGTDGDYSPSSTIPEGPNAWTQANDVEAPASIGAKGAVTVRAIKLHRDIFYTHDRGNVYQIYYVQPGHYMCMGDNSAQSSDSRTWGTVPERLMLGKAVFVFWPSWPLVPMRQNRVGFIK